MPDDKPSDLETRVKAKAAELGFAACGIARADAAPLAGERLHQWLAEGRHGDMIWMEERRDQRASPAGLWPAVRSVIALGMSYAPKDDPLRMAEQGEVGRISVYAQGADYHDVIKRQLKALGRWLASDAVGVEYPFDLKVFVDTAPVMEKPLAEAAGLGWQGKHTNLVSRAFGSWLFLGSIFTTAELAPDAPEIDRCGSCRACLDICPTDAFPAPYRLDARRCISYLTIEHKGPIPLEFRAAMGNRVYGCDDCLAACPWNKFARVASEQKLVARDDLLAPRLADLLKLDDAAFRVFFSGSPVKRIGRDRFIRNVLIAAGNSDDLSLAAPCRALLDDASPLVRGAAVWALSRLLPRREVAELAAGRAEPDGEVAGEWSLALRGDVK